MKNKEIKKLSYSVLIISLFTLTACSDELSKNESLEIEDHKKEMISTSTPNEESILESETVVNSNLSENMQSGLAMLEIEDYSAAEEFFYKELEQNIDSKEEEQVNTYLTQINHYTFAVESFEDSQLGIAQENFEIVSSIENGYSKLNDYATDYIKQIQPLLEKEQSLKSSLIGYWGIKATPDQIEAAGGQGPFTRHSLVIAISENNFRWTQYGSGSDYSYQSKFLAYNEQLELDLVDLSIDSSKEATIYYLPTKSNDSRDQIELSTNSYTTGSTTDENGDLVNINDTVITILERMTEEEYFGDSFYGNDLNQWYQVQYDLEGFW